MKPNFALSLFFDKVELLHRSGEDWTSIGEVPFDADDLAGSLSDLRKKALTHDPAGLRTKLILPDEQVKFLSLPKADADDAAVRVALEDATPYALDDLVYEYASDGRRTHIAAVAKETLGEAEAFAVEHRFAPVSIVAQTVVGRFDGEPFFGETKACAALIGPDDQVERDNAPAAKVPAKPEPQAEPAAAKKPAPKPKSKPAAETKPAQEPDVKAADKPKDAPVAPPSPKSPPAQIKAAKPETAPDPAPKPVETAKPVDSKSPSTPKPTPPAHVAADDAPVDEPVFASRARSATVEAHTLEQAVSSVRPKQQTEAIRPKGPPRAAPQAVPPRYTPGTPPPAVAERLAKVARTSITADRMADMPPTSVSPVPERPKAAGAKAPPVTGTSAATTTSPKAIAATLKPQRTPPSAAGGGGLFASRRADEAAQEDDGDMAPQAAAATAAERRNMTVFDERAGQSRGRSKYLALILTAILLLFMAAVAAFAAMFTEDGIAGWFGGSDPEIAQDPILSATPSDTTPLAPLAAPTFDDGTALIVPGSSDRVETAFSPAEQLARVVEDEAAALDAAVIAIPEPPAEQQAALDPPVVTPETPRGTVLSPAEADRFYAATGVWLRAPRLPLLPSSQDLDRVTRTAVEDTFQVAFVPSELPEIGVLYPDAPLPVQIDPPTAETVFERDDRGLLLATADGTLSPYGMLIYAGLPNVIPPTRPGTPVPEPVVVAEAEVVPDVEVPADNVIALETTEADPSEAVVATLEALIAEAAPDAPALLPIARDARGLIVATAEGATSDGLIVFAGLPAVVPPTRPGTPIPDAVAAIQDGVAPETEVPAEDLVAEETLDADPTEVVVETLEALITDAPAPLSVARDARGLIVATAEGATSDGLIVFAGLPTVVPPTRPGTTVPDVDTLVAEIADTPVSEDDTGGIVEEDATTEEDVPDVAVATVPYDGVRPTLRPSTLDVPEAPVVLASYAGPRPNLRPETLATPEAAVEPAEPVIDSSTVAATLALIVAAAPDPLANATQQAVAVATIPAVRPRNFDRVVSAARARQQTTTTTTTTTATAPTTVSSAAAQPTGPIPQSVASAATIESAINLRQVNLIGVFGRPNDRRALVRLGNGSFVRVSVGDSLDGGQVTAIGDNVINYVRRGQTIALGVPG